MTRDGLVYCFEAKRKGESLKRYVGYVERWLGGRFDMQGLADLCHAYACGVDEIAIRLVAERLKVDWEEVAAKVK
ncbi:MAG: hypothetical protein MUC88_27100 [Planctomycetes bacterium]|jgi:hypothetical protein|nr:hypothetical protein [Planctomycetota bacterium]